MSIDYLSGKGDLKIGQYSNITCNVELKIDIHSDSMWIDSNPDYDPNNYCDGVRIEGELSFDVSPLNSFNTKHPVKNNAVGELVFKKYAENSKLNIIIVEQTSVVEIVPGKIFRYFWLFFVVGKPIWDGLKIFPNNYRGVNVNKIYSCVNFRGDFIAVITALSRIEAEELLKAKLLENKIQLTDWKIKEIDVMKKEVNILTY